MEVNKTLAKKILWQRSQEAKCPPHMHSLCKFSWEEYKKQLEASFNFSEFSTYCSEKWSIMSAKAKGKFKDMAKADKICYEREMKTNVPPKERP